MTVDELSLDVAIGKHRNAKTWKNTQKTWDEVKQSLSQPHRTSVTYLEYLALPKGRQAEIKDVGAFVGGYCVGGRRKKESVTHRQLLTLDADYATLEFWSDYCRQFDNAALIYSTHKHSPEKPRYRLVIPTDRPMTAAEHEPVARMVASMVGIEHFDHTTYDINRLMYYPAAAKDGVFDYQFKDGNVLEVDHILSLYKDWKDVSEWPQSDREVKAIFNGLYKQEDPDSKSGYVGLYCRAYSFDDIFEKHIPGLYEAADAENRYTYTKGSTYAGAVMYDDNFIYSHHATDPAGGRLCNKFDLVRIHLFGAKDDTASPHTPQTKLPSYQAMIEWIGKDKEVRKLRDAEKLAEVSVDFAGNTDWMQELDADSKGNYETSVKNIRIILENDPFLAHRFGLNRFTNRVDVQAELPWNNDTRVRPWTDEDWSGLRCYLGEAPYELQRTPKMEDVMDGIVKQRFSFHPVYKYLDGLSWDGVERIDTLFIDYLGADDSEYVRAVTRKSLIACIARIRQPGTKFDYVPTLVGKQGTGKSTILSKLGGEWFSDNFSFHMLSKGDGKQAKEQVQGVWILEIGEMSGMRKTEAETAKSFISSTEDIFRPAYGRETVIRKRQFVPFGTSNDPHFLKVAMGGNRRFWPIEVYINTPTKSIWADLTQDVINQIWAEAQEYYSEGESLHLPEHVEEMAREIQADHEEVDDRTAVIDMFIDMNLSKDWAAISPEERANYFTHRTGTDLALQLTEPKRDVVTAAEIWVEAFGQKQENMNMQTTRFIHTYMRNLPDWQALKRKTYPPYGKQTIYQRIEPPEDIS